MTSDRDWIRRLPCSQSPEEEFQGPTGEWFSVHRAIVLDSWLTWRDAFPTLPLVGRMDKDAACRITALTQRVHAFHMSLPEYRRTIVSPFHVGQWWDPDANDAWSQGDRVLLRLEGYTASHVARALPPRIQLELAPKSEHWIEMALPPNTECPIHSLDYNRVVTTETAVAAHR